MKKVKWLVFIFGLFGGLNSVQAQHGKVVSGWRYLQDYLSEKDTTLLIKAKQALDQAIVNPATNQSAKTFFYAGQINQCLFEASLEFQINKHKEVTDLNKRSVLAYRLSKGENLVTASGNYKQALDFDGTKEYNTDLLKRLKECSQYLGNIAISFYDNAQFGLAGKYFLESAKVKGNLGLVDSTEYFNAKVAFEQAKDSISADKMYALLLEKHIGGPNTYINYQYFLLNTLKDTARSFEVLKKGRLLYPKNEKLINNELSFYVNGEYKGSREEMISHLVEVAKVDSTNVLLLLEIGTLYDQLAHPKNASTANTPKPEMAAQYLELAKKYYLASYRLDPTNSTTQYNLAALNANLGYQIYEKYNPNKHDAQNKQFQVDSDKYLKEAVKYMEQYFKNNPNDCEALKALSRMYLSVDEKAKSDALIEKGKVNCQ